MTGFPHHQNETDTSLCFTRIDTPVGVMIAAASSRGLALLEFDEGPRIDAQLDRIARRIGRVPVPGSNEILTRTQAELHAYFARALHRFTVPLHTSGTPFQERAWAALCEIPYGQTRSYGEQARAINAPDAVRAVARANGDNRIAIVIPCHRVIGANGKLTGYGGGLWRKEYILGVEQGGTLLFPDAGTYAAVQRNPSPD